MAELPIPFPQEGISDTFSYEAQPPGTTVDALNVRSIDSKTGRARGAQREGLARLCPSALGAGNGKVQALTSVVHDERQVVYSDAVSTQDGDLTSWSKNINSYTAGSTQGVFVCAVDTLGNVYTIDEDALLIQYNRDGVKQWEFSLPVFTANHAVRTLTIDEYGTIFVGVSEGTTGQHLAWIRAYERDDETVLRLLWSMKPQGYTEKILIRNDKLYAAVNATDTAKSRIVVYESIYTSAPSEVQSWYVPFPVNDATFNEDGEIITAHQPAETMYGALAFNRFIGPRSYYPASQLTTHVVEPSAMRWNPTMLPQWEDRRWCWLSAESIPQQLGSESILDGDAITEWRDISGRGQVVLRPSSVTGDLAPKWISNGLAQRPTVRFEGDNYRLESEGSTGTSTSQDDAQKTVLPGTRGYAVVIVAKLSDDASKPENLLYQDNHWDPNDDALDDDFTGWGGNVDAGLAYCRFDHLVAVNAKKSTPTVPAECLNNQYYYSPGGNEWFRDLYLHDKVTAKSSNCGLTNGTSYWVRQKNGAADGALVHLSASAPSNGVPGAAVVGSNGIVQLELTRHRTLEFDAGGICIMAESAGNKSPEDAGYFPNGENNYAHTNQGRFDNGAGVAIISIVRDNEECHADFSTSVLRVNGVPVSRWKGIRTATRTGFKSVIGKMRTSDAYDELHMDVTTQLAGLTADISEIFVLRSYDDPEDSKRKICTFPDYNANAIGTNPEYNSTSDTELERIEAYFAWKYGVSHLLDRGGRTPNTAPVWTNTNMGTGNIGQSEYSHPYSSPANIGIGITGGPPSGNRDASANIDGIAWASSDGLMCKWNFQRGLRWAKSQAGVGYAVASHGDRVMGIGPFDSSVETDAPTVNVFKDSGPSCSLLASFSMNVNGIVKDYVYKHPRVDVDSDGTFWIPGYWNSQPTGDSKNVWAFSVTEGSPTLNEVFRYQTGGSTYLSEVIAARCVAIDKTDRDYTGNANTITLPESIVVGTQSATIDPDAEQPTLHYVDLVQSEVSASTNARNITWVGVCDGNVYTFDTTSVTPVPTGANAFDPDSRFTTCVAAFSKVYMTDGLTYKVYDPKTNTVEPWLSSKAGRIPSNCRLMTFWRGRMVLARGPDDPHNWHMSAVGDPTDWDQFPPDGPLETQAISGNNSVVGGNHDIINCLIPYDRERMMIGGDHSIHMMWGDPMAGGVIAMLSDVTGISFGTGWCKDSSGVLYFYGSRGGVYAMAPGGQSDRISNHPQRISTQSIDRRLSEVDLETHYIGMVWDDVEHRLHVYQMPYDVNVGSVDHWCWEKRTGAWWVDRFSNVNLSPTAVAVMDGDAADDRVVAIGCQDGVVRYTSRDAATDDGYAIDSYVTIGPFYTGSQSLRIRNPKITLARDQGGCWVELFSSDTPDVVGDPQQSALLGPGQNPKQMIGVRGAYCWLRLRGALYGQRWAYESGKIDTIDSGRRVAP